MASKKSSSADTYTFDGNVHSAPDWVDRNWAGYDGGPALHVPQDTGADGPYVTKPCRVGDTITRVEGKGDGPDTFTIAPAADPGADAENVNIGDPTGPTFRPAQETFADLGDLVKTGAVEKDDMDPSARAQLEARQGTSSAGKEAREAAAKANAPRDAGTRARDGKK